MADVMVRDFGDLRVHTGREAESGASLRFTHL